MINLQIPPDAFDDVIRRAVEATVRRLREERPGGPERLLLGKPEAAEMLGVSLATLDRLTAPRGDLRPVRLDGRVLFAKSELERWASARMAREQEGGQQA
ncbi:MAG: helix-turn-helix domain-containing protein [Patescibacteria group bacterium]|nr:helix-turn-helix domain-containing protein [Patescibacteria group bacterium]